MRIRRRSFKTQYVKPKSLRLRLIFYKFFTDKINAKIYKRYLTVIINPHALVAQKNADQRWLIANSSKKR